MRLLTTLPAAVLALVGSMAQAQTGSLALAGGMGSKALLVIDGQTTLLAVGESARGVTLKSFDGSAARVERGGVVIGLSLGGTPAALAGTGGNSGITAGGADMSGNRREIVIPVSAGGHFIASGAINNRPVSFLVDTGATLVAIGRSEAERLGLDLAGAQRGSTWTAGGTVPVLALTLSSVRVGEVEVRNVPAIVVPGELPQVLLGNSFLQRFQMRRDNDLMRLEQRR